MPNGDKFAAVKVVNAHLPGQDPPYAILQRVLVLSMALLAQRSCSHVVPQYELKGSDPNVLLVTLGDVDGQRAPQTLLHSALDLA